MSITGSNTNKDIANLKKDISEIRSSLAENGVLMAQLSSIVNSVPDIGNVTYRLSSTESTPPGTITWSVSLVNTFGVSSGVFNPIYDNSEYKFSFYYPIPSDKNPDSYSADKLIVRPSINRMNGVVPDLLFTDAQWFEDLHLDLRVSKEDNTKCRIDFKFFKTNTSVSFLTEHMPDAGAICDIDMLVIDYN